MSLSQQCQDVIALIMQIIYPEIEGRVSNGSAFF